MEHKERLYEIPNPNKPEVRQKLGRVKICPKALYKSYILFPLAKEI